MEEPDWIITCTVPDDEDDDGGASGWALYFVQDPLAGIDSVLVVAQSALLAANWFDSRLGVSEIHMERVSYVEPTADALEALDVEHGAAYATPQFLERVGARCEETDAHRAGIPKETCRAHLVRLGGRTFLHYGF